LGKVVGTPFLLLCGHEELEKRGILEKQPFKRKLEMGGALLVRRAEGIAFDFSGTSIR